MDARGLDSRLDRLRDLGGIRNYARGAMVFEEGQPASWVYAIVSGRIELSCGSRIGADCKLWVARPGDLLALGSVIEGCEHTSSAEALDPVVVSVVSAGDTLEFFRRDPELRMRLLEVLSKDVLRAYDVLRSLGGAPTRARHGNREAPA